MYKIGILTQDKIDSDESLKVFDKIAKNFDAQIKVIDPTEYLPLVSKNQSINEQIDVLMPRISTESSYEHFMLGIYIFEYFSLFSKIPVIGNTEGLTVGFDKFRQCQIIASNGYDIPKTTLVSNKKMISETLKNFSYPLILKQQFGYGGAGIAIVESERSAKSVIHSFIREKKPIIVQEYLPLDEYKDYRVHVIGGKSVGGIIRTAPKNDFRANVMLDGSYVNFMPDEELSKQAIAIAKLVNLEIVAVDFLKYKGKNFFIELNPALGIDPYEGENKSVSDSILKHCIEKIKGHAVDKS